MVKTDLTNSNTHSKANHNAVPPYKKFKMDLKIEKHRPFANMENNEDERSQTKLQQPTATPYATTITIAPQRIPKRVSNINITTHHHYRANGPHHALPPPKPAPPVWRPPYPNVHPLNDDNASYHSSVSRQSYRSSSSAHTASTGTASACAPNASAAANFDAGILNPFNDPPSDCGAQDVRWIWRKLLEEKRGHVRNRKYYSNYVGSKKSRKFYVIRTTDPNGSTIEAHKSRLPSTYCGNHHLKHLVKIGCPKHDLAPILSDLSYSVSPAICTHKSHLCASSPSANTNRILLHSVSLKNVGLVFKRNAFSTAPLTVQYIPDDAEQKTANSGDGVYKSDIYVKRIANTNFSKAFRPGSYGKLESLKKGSWKEGKIFYVFEKDELVLNVNEHLYLTFDLKSCASNSDNEQNTIDGWKNIAGGVGFYRPPETREICSVLVLRKHPNFPLECLQNSTINVYATNTVYIPAGKLLLGTHEIYLPHCAQLQHSSVVNNDSNNNSNSANSNNMMNPLPPPCIPSPPRVHSVQSRASVPSQKTTYTVPSTQPPRYQHAQQASPSSMAAEPTYQTVLTLSNNSTNSSLMDSPSSTPYDEEDDANEHAMADYNNGNTVSAAYGGTANMMLPNDNGMVFTTNHHESQNHNNRNDYNAMSMPSVRSVPSMPSMPPSLHASSSSVQGERHRFEQMKNEYESKFRSLQHQNRLLLHKNNQLQSLNMQLMDCNTDLTQQKQQLTTQIHELQTYMNQQHEQITKLVGISSKILDKLIDASL